MTYFYLRPIPDFVAHAAQHNCSVCDEQISLYNVGDTSWATPYNIVWSRIAGDSANGYEYTHQHCMELEDK